MVDQTWEIIGVHQIKAGLLDSGKRAAVAAIFAPPQGAAPDDIEFYAAQKEAWKLADQWADENTRPQVEARLQKRGVNSDSITALAFHMKVGSLEAAERILASLESRRNETLRDIESRQQSTGSMLRQVSDKVIGSASVAR